MFILSLKHAYIFIYENFSIDVFIIIIFNFEILKRIIVNIWKKYIFMKLFNIVFTKLKKYFKL